MNPHLTVVPDEVPVTVTETPAARIRRLQDEARMLAFGQIKELDRSIKRLALDAGDIAQGGDAYPAGIRNLADRLAADLEAARERFVAIMARIPAPKVRP